MLYRQNKKFRVNVTNFIFVKVIDLLKYVSTKTKSTQKGKAIEKLEISEQVWEHI